MVTNVEHHGGKKLAVVSNGGGHDGDGHQSPGDRRVSRCVRGCRHDAAYKPEARLSLAGAWSGEQLPVCQDHAPLGFHLRNRAQFVFDRSTATPRILKPRVRSTAAFISPRWRPAAESAATSFARTARTQ